LGSKILEKGGTVYSGLKETRTLYDTEMIGKCGKNTKITEKDHGRRYLKYHNFDYSSLSLEEI